MKKMIVSILALVMVLSMMLIPVSAAEWPEDACAVEITVEFVDCNPDDVVSFTLKDLSWAGDYWVPYVNQTLTFSAENTVLDLMVPKKDISWAFGADFAQNYWVVEAPEGYTVTAEFIDGDGNNPSTKGHAKFTVTGLGATEAPAPEILKGTPTVDGKLDALYEDSYQISVDKSATIWVPKEDTDDVKTTAYFLHDGEFLYVCAVVTGDSCIVDTGATGWACDGIDVWFMGPESPTRTKITLDAFAQPYDEDNKYIGDFENGLNVDLTKIEKAAVRTENGYVVEAKIPVPYYSESEGTIGINVQLNNVYDADANTDTGNKKGGFYGAQYNNPVIVALGETEAVTPDPENPKDGDTISVFVALMAISAVGAAVIIKKKEF